MVERYRSRDIEITGMIFEQIGDYYEKFSGYKVNTRDLIDCYAASYIRRLFDIGFRKVYTMTLEDILDTFFSMQHIRASKHIENFNDGELMWIGQLYTKVAYESDIAFYDCYRTISFDSMRDLYGRQFELSESDIINKLRLGV